MFLTDKQYYIKEGEFRHGIWELSGNKLEREGNTLDLSSLKSCMLVSDTHATSHSTAGRVAGGIIGGLLLGPIGALGGLIGGGKSRIDETIIHGSFFDGRVFTAQSTQLGAAVLCRIAQENAVKFEAIGKARAMPSIADTIDCPMCAETIMRKAKVCRFCGHQIAASPTSKKTLFESKKPLGKTISIQKCIDRYRKGSAKFHLEDEQILDVFRVYAAALETNFHLQSKDIDVRREAFLATLKSVASSVQVKEEKVFKLISISIPHSLFCRKYTINDGQLEFEQEINL